MDKIIFLFRLLEGLTWLFGFPLLMETNMRIAPEILFSILNVLKGFSVFAFHLVLCKAKRQIWDEFVRRKSHKLRNDLRSVSRFFNRECRSAFRPVKKGTSVAPVDEGSDAASSRVHQPDAVPSDSTNRSPKVFTISRFDVAEKQNFDDELKFIPIGHQKCASFLTVSSHKSIDLDASDNEGCNKGHDDNSDGDDSETDREKDVVSDVTKSSKNCSTPSNDVTSTNYFSDDISARISRLNESLRRIKSKDDTLTKKFSPVSFKLDDMSNIFFDQL